MSPENHKNISSFEGWDLPLVAYGKKRIANSPKRQTHNEFKQSWDLAGAQEKCKAHEPFIGGQELHVSVLLYIEIRFCVQRVYEMQDSSSKYTLEVR